jgi:hypothetical protein
MSTDLMPRQASDNLDGARVTLVLDSSSPHARIFLPLLDKVRQELVKLRCHVACGHQPIRESVNIVFGAAFNPGYWDSKLTKKDILVNLEPLYTEKFRRKFPEYLTLLKKFKTLDIYTENRNYLAECELIDVPPLFVDPTTVTPQDTFNLGGLFVGTIDINRQKILRSLRDSGVNFRAHFGVYGAELYHLLRQSKFFLNLDIYTDSRFNKYRLGLCLGTPSVYVGSLGEICSDDDEFLAQSLSDKLLISQERIHELPDALSSKDIYDEATKKQLMLGEVLSFKFSKQIKKITTQWI